MKSEITHVEWKDVSNNGPAKSKLIGTIEILGCLMHLEAFEVKKGENETQVTVNEDFTTDLDTLFEVFAPNDHTFDSVIIDGREYVLFASPFC